MKFVKSRNAFTTLAFFFSFCFVTSNVYATDTSVSDVAQNNNVFTTGFSNISGDVSFGLNYLNSKIVAMTIPGFGGTLSAAASVLSSLHALPEEYRPKVTTRLTICVGLGTTGSGNLSTLKITTDGFLHFQLLPSSHVAASHTMISFPACVVMWSIQ